MTTNKPEVAGFISEVGIKKLREDEYTGDWTLYAGPVRNSVTPLIRLSDYEALQTDYEKLRKYIQMMIDQTTPLVPDPDRPGWSRRIQLDEVIAERDSLRAECEKLRKDAERYQSLMEAVLREIPHREGRRGNAPGHGHSVPGVWDCDNGALAGKKCAWCKVWNEALTALQKEHKP